MDTSDWDSVRLLRIINYCQFIQRNIFVQSVGQFLSSSFLRGANLYGLFLGGADLRGTNLHGANLDGADLRGADLHGVDLSNAELNGTYFRGANLNGAILNNANLCGANLCAVDLRDANLSGTNLRGAFILNGFLNNANLSSANLCAVNLSGTILSGANFSGAFLRGVFLKEVRWDKNTRWFNAEGLLQIMGVSEDLKQEPGFYAAVLLCQGENLAQQGKIEDAIEVYNQAQASSPDEKVSANFWNKLCWFGSIHNYASMVLYAGEQAVMLEPENPEWKDSRGLARALTGDIEGAILDFQTFLDGNLSKYPGFVKSRRRHWLEALRAGRNPFTFEELEALRKDEVDGAQ